MEKKALGRGLEALIPVDSSAPRERVQMLKVSQIEPSPLQPRFHFSEEKIEELAQSIKEKGVIQPILVRTVEEDRYELVAGERRLRAVKRLGLPDIPAIVRKVADADLLETSIVENVQREELNPIEEARAYRRLAEDFGYTQETIARRVGKDKSSVSNLLRILNLPEKIQEYLSRNTISFGHARALLSLPNTRHQLSFCERIIKKGLSVRQVEWISSKRVAPKKSAPRPGASKDPHLLSVEEKLQHLLGTKVRVHHGKKRGRIEIEYYSLEDLDRLLKRLGLTI